MQYWQCKCGDQQGYGSTGPRPCDWCPKCNSTTAYGPNGHRIVQPAHQMIETEVETDDGKAVLTRCAHCLKTKKQLDGQPMEPFKPQGAPA